MNLIEISVKRPVLATMIMLALAGMGMFCYIQIPRELFPEIDMPVVTVMTVYEGAGPEEIEQLITKEIEDQISTVEGIKHIDSISQQGLSLVIIEFNLEIDVDVAAADVRAKVDVIRELLPEEAEDPITEKFDFNAQPILQLAITAPRPLKEVFFYADERVKDRLASVKDVASVDLIGGQEREIHILVNQQRLRSHGLSITHIIQTIAAANLESPGGYIRQNSREYNIRMKGKFQDLDEIRNMKVLLPAQSQRTVYLRDIARVEDAFKDMRDKARANGRAAVGVTIQKRADGNTVQVDKDVRQTIDGLLTNALPNDFSMDIINESASWITSSIQNVFTNIYTGIIMTAITLFLFLHTFRSVIIVSLAMPISVMATFLIMYLAGFTVNLMSMMGLAMTIGILVNNAILVLENITRYLQLGHKPQEAAYKGTSEIATAVASTTLTNVVVFVPIAFMGGIVGQFFKDFGLTATIATMVSLLISFSLTPMLGSLLLNKKVTSTEGSSALDRFGRRWDGGLDYVRNLYGHMLHWCLGHRYVPVLVVVCFLVGAFQLTRFIGGEFITPMDQGKFTLLVEMPTGTRLDETENAVRSMEKIIENKLGEKGSGYLISYFATIGRVLGGDVGGSSQAVNIAQIQVNIVDKTKRDVSTKAVMNSLRSILAAADIPGAKIKLLEEEAGGGSGAPIQMQIIGDDMDNIRAFADAAVAIMKDPCQVAGTVDVDTNYRLGQPEIRITPDKEKCLDRGVDTQYLSEVIAASFEGLIVSEYREGAYNYDIRVRNDEEYRRHVTDVNELTIMNDMGQLIALPELADIKVSTGPSQLYRKDRQSQITVSCSVAGRSPGEVVADIREAMKPVLEKYPNIHLFFAGETEMMEESFQRLGVAFIMAICLTYMLLASLMESFFQPFIILFALPLSLIGVFTALFLMGGTFSIFSIMSIIMLVGLVVNNNIIVIDYINTLRKKGMERNAAIIESGTTRLRPIIMANWTTVIALIPLALGLGWGGEMRAPMAMVMIGGLIANDWIGLLVGPVLYTFYDDILNFFRRLLRPFLHHND